MNHIELIGVSKSYDGRQNVIDGLNLTVKRGEFVTLVGPSGCGKSTLLRMIAGLEPITAGTLTIDGRVANQMLPKDRDLSMVFQNYALYPHMTVRENILFGLDVKRVPKGERQRRLTETAELVGLEDYLDRKPGQLSGGQRQRVALARSICSHAPICLMDEPLSNLDAKLRAQMRGEIRRLQRKLGLTTVYVTHDQVEAMTMGDRIVVLHQGVVQQVGTPAELYNRPTNEFVASFIGSPQINLLPALAERDGLRVADSLTLLLDGAMAGALGGAASVKVGIRSEHIRPSMAVDALRMQVQGVEFMGSETQLVLALGSAACTARWPGQWDLQVGDRVSVEFPPEACCLFDGQSGQLLYAPTMSAHSQPNQEVTSHG